MVKYYKKLSPKTPVILADGTTAVRFETFDGLLGYYATEHENVQAHFLQMMQQQRYGITEISAEEYQRDFFEKKTSSTQSQPPIRWREEMLGSSARPQGYDPVSALGPEHVAAVVAVKGSDIRKEVPVRMDPNAPAHEPPQRLGDPPRPKTKPQAAAAKFVPNVGKRKKPAPPITVGEPQPQP